MNTNEINEIVHEATRAEKAHKTGSIIRVIHSSDVESGEEHFRAAKLLHYIWNEKTREIQARIMFPDYYELTIDLFRLYKSSVKKSEFFLQN